MRRPCTLALAVLTALGLPTAPAAAVATKKGVSVNNHPGMTAAPAVAFGGDRAGGRRTGS